jgi:hypothetical protein
MGTRAYSEVQSLLNRNGKNLPSNYKLQVLYDGVDTAGSGKQLNLPGNELWWDGTGLYRIGLNIGPTFQNIGTVDCTVYGAIVPKEYAQLINHQASLVTLMSGRWKSLGLLHTGDAINTNNLVFSVFRFVFTPGSGLAGEVVAATL